VLQFLIVLAILAIVVLVVSAPIRRARMAPAAPTARLDVDADEESAQAEGAGVSQVAELEAARDAKYREIRDAELDHWTGKLSDADFEVVDRGLRGEAVEILHELDRMRGGDEDQEGSEVRGAGGEGERRASADADPPGTSRI
jgi:Na+-transporting methylmalonyl-CoA/oxaloacetate decarboxylase gamma subunit